MKNRILSNVLAFFLCFMFSQTACTQSETKQNTPESPETEIDLKTSELAVPDSVEEKKEQAEIGSDTVSIIGVGDMMLGTNYPSSAYLPPNDGKDLFTEVNSILQDADVTFGNLEGVLLDKGGSVKHCNNPKLCYAFRMPEKLVDNLKTAGFDLLSIANNHLGDFGQSGRNNTVKVLKEKGFEFAGLLSVPTAIFEKNGVKYGFAAFAPNRGTVDIRKIAEAEKSIKKLAEQTDIVIVSFHGGAEGPQHRHVTRKTEKFYGENRGNVYEFAHRLVDAGADIIFGHGPHVTRALEIYKERFIIYSMGNFCTYKRFNLKGVNGIAPIVKVYTDRKGKFLKGKITAIKQLYPGGVKLDPTNKVIAEIKSLIRTDFPESPAVISDDGDISIKK